MCRLPGMEAADLALDVNLVAWMLACAAAILFYYSDPHSRANPVFENQLHCLSGVILCNRLLFGTVLSGFGGAVLLSSADRVRGDLYATVLLMLMFMALMVVVHYDVEDYKPAHFSALAALLAAGSLYVWHTLADGWLWWAYVAATGLFVLVLLINIVYTRWLPPYMTAQALAEILWVVVFAVSVVAVSFRSWW